MFLDVFDDALHLAVTDERPLHAERLGRTDRRIQHIAASDQLFRARHINDGARVYLRLDRKGDTRRDIRLDKTGDDVHRGTLGAQS